MKYSLISIISIVILLIVLSVFTGCRTGNDSVPPASTTYIRDSSIDSNSTTGTLRIRLYRGTVGSGNVAAYQTVALFARFEDIQFNIRMAEYQTDNNGYVDFGRLNYGNYYLSVRRYENNQPINLCTEVVQIQAGRKLEKYIYCFF